MYGELRWKIGYREEVDKFIEAAQKHATLVDNSDAIICPCHDCKNKIAWRDKEVLRTHLITRGFVKDYTTWIHHGETAVVNDDDYVLDDTDPDVEDLLSQYSEEFEARMNPESDNEVRGGDGWDCNDTGGGGDGCHVVMIMMTEHVSGMKMTVIIWRTCFGPLDPK